MEDAAVLNTNIVVDSPNVVYTESEIISSYDYSDARVHGNILIPTTEKLMFKTERHVPRVGALLVGWGGNNGTTLTAGILANKLGLNWETKEGTKTSNYLGSICKSITVRVGIDDNQKPVYIPLNNLIPLLDPNDLEISGWDISGVNMGDAMRRAKVLDWDLQQQIYPILKEMVPMPSIYLPEWIVANQEHRADNLIHGTKFEMMSKIRHDIRDFKNSRGLDKVIVIWTANTEKFCVVRHGLNDTAEHLLNAIKENSDEVSVSTLFAVASIFEECTYINGSPQNTFVPGCIELAERLNVLIAGDDFKSGQTKLKSVLSDFIINSGLKLQSVVSYNHLGNNDTKNLSTPQTFMTKELSKSGVIEDVVRANRIMYNYDESPDHCAVMKYVPFVGDNKTTMDEYVNEIFMGGKNTLALHNTCEDSMLTAPLILDLIMLAELCTRIQVKRDEDEKFTKMHPVMSILSFLLKSPLVPSGSPVIHCLFPQRYAIINFLKALIGLPPESFLMLEHRLDCLRNNDRE